MRLSMATLLQRLVAEGHAAPDAAARARLALGETAEEATPWYVRAAAGIGAWVATALLVGFLASAVADPDENAALVLGLALVAGAVYLRRRATAEFARQLALAASFAGQVLILLRVANATDSGVVTGLVALALSAALVPLVPDAVHRFMSAVVGSVATVVVAVELRLGWGVDAPGLAPSSPGLDLAVRGADVAVLALVAFAAWVWRGGSRTRGRDLAEMLEPVGYGTVVALLGLLLLDAFIGPSLGFVAGGRAMSRWQLGAATTVGVTAALCALVLAVAREGGRRASGEATVVALASAALLGAVTLPTPGIVAAVAALALGFDRRRPVLVGLAVLFLVAFAALHYHSLRLTLLEKSGVLVASGLLLLAARAYVTTRRAAAEEPA
jgi:hypothetical protein